MGAPATPATPGRAELARLIEALVPAMRAAAARIEEVRRSGDFAAENKPDSSPVTAADRDAEAILRAAIRAAAPEAVIVGEEGVADGDMPAPAPAFWLLDPLDGTRDFLAGRDGYTVNAGLVVAGAPVLGLVGHPPSGRLWAGASGLGAFLEPEGEARVPLRPRPFADPPVLLLSHSHLDAETRAWAEAVPGAVQATAGSSIKFCLLAAGEADAYPRYGLTFEWDTAAADAILRAAGGITLGRGGRPLAYGKDGYRNGPFLALADPAAAGRLPAL